MVEKEVKKTITPIPTSLTWYFLPVSKPREELIYMVEDNATKTALFHQTKFFGFFP